MIVSDDLERLARLLRLPDGVSGARWALGPVGMSGGFAVGPQDTRLVALLRFGGSDPLEPAPREEAAAIPLTYARAVLPAEALEALPVVGDDVVLAGPFRTAEGLTRMPHRVKFAAEVGGGVLVHALSY